MLPSCGCSLHRETVIKNDPNPLLQKAEKLKVFWKLWNVYQAIVKFWGSCCVSVNHSYIVILKLSGQWIC